MAKRQRVESAEVEPTPIDAIKTVWSEIEPYLEIEDTIAVAQTCRAFDEEIIDQATRKVKVSAFVVNGFKGSCTRVEKGNNKDERIIDYIPKALNRIYFPSLKTLHISFPRTRIHPDEYYEDERDRQWCFEDGCHSALPILVTNLAYAHNLVSLHFDGSMMMQMENRGEVAVLLRILGDNLRQCKKLKTLTVNNCGPTIHGEDYMEKWGEYKHSVELMKALIPTLKQRKNDLTKFVYTTAYEETDDWDCVDDIYHEFFTAILSTKSLLYLRLQIINSYRLFNSLVSAAKSLLSSGAGPPQDLQHLWLGHKPYHFESVELESLFPLMNYFKSCHGLDEVYFHFPREFWKEDGSVRAWLEFIRQKSSITQFGCHFDYIQNEQPNGAVLDQIEDFLIERRSNQMYIDALELGGLRKVSVVQIRRILGILSRGWFELEHGFDLRNEKLELKDCETGENVDNIWVSQQDVVDVMTVTSAADGVDIEI